MPQFDVQDRRAYVAQGANTLRGGVRVYSAKCLESNWVEDRQIPGALGSRPHAATEYAARAREHSGAGLPKYGAELLEPGAAPAVLGPVSTSADLVHPVGGPGSDQWQSITAAAHNSEGKRTEFATLRQAPRVPPAEELASYRQRWIRDDPAAVDARWHTASTDINCCPHVPPALRPRATRVLPGVPKAVERFRDKVRGKHGLMGLRVVGKAMAIACAAVESAGPQAAATASKPGMPAGSLDMDEFAEVLRECDLTFTPDELSELFSFLDRDRSGTASTSEFLDAMRPRWGDERQQCAARAWAAVAGSADVEQASMLAVRNAFDATAYPDVRAGLMSADEAADMFAGLLARADAFGDADGAVDKAEFMALLRDMSATVNDDEAFIGMVNAMFHLQPPDVSVARGVTTRLVLATYSDGSRALVKVPRDRFFDETNKAQVIARARRAGRPDVADVSLDF